MAKALYGFLGEPRAAMLLKQIANLQAKVREMEKQLEAKEAEVIALRAIAEANIEATEHEREEVRALA